MKARSLEDRIRDRAYFHFVNQTGCSWINAESNWLEAEREERAEDDARREHASLVARLRPIVAEVLDTLAPGHIVGVLDTQSGGKYAIEVGSELNWRLTSAPQGKGEPDLEEKLNGSFVIHS